VVHQRALVAGQVRCGGRIGRNTPFRTPDTDQLFEDPSTTSAFPAYRPKILTCRRGCEPCKNRMVAQVLAALIIMLQCAHTCRLWHSVNFNLALRSWRASGPSQHMPLLHTILWWFCRTRLYSCFTVFAACNSAAVAALPSLQQAPSKYCY
jgi:hypothetical protein